MEVQLSRICPGLLENNGELPREPPSCAFPYGRVSLPFLQHLGGYAVADPPPAHASTLGPGPNPASAQASTNVYALLRAASPSHRVQRFVDFRLLLRLCAMHEAGLSFDAPVPVEEADRHRAIQTWLKAEEHLDMLHAQAFYTLDLLEVVMLMGAWHAAAAASLINRDDPAAGSSVEVNLSEDASDVHQSPVSFIAHVLKVAAGAAKDCVPSLPKFHLQSLKDEEGTLRAQEDAVIQYSMVSNTFFLPLAPHIRQCADPCASHACD